MSPVDEELDNNGEKIIYTDENDEEDALNHPVFCPLSVLDKINSLFKLSSLLQVYLPLLPLVLAILLGQLRRARLHFSLILCASLLINISVALFELYFIAGRYLGELFDILVIASLSWYMLYKLVGARKSPF